MAEMTDREWRNFCRVCRIVLWLWVFVLVTAAMNLTIDIYRSF